jgi:hypothetical protein
MRQIWKRALLALGLIIILCVSSGLISAFIARSTAKKSTWQEFAPYIGFPGGLTSDGQSPVSGLEVNAYVMPFLVRVEIRAEFLDVGSDRLLQSDLYLALFGYTKRVRSRSALDEPPAKKADTS